MVSKIILSVLPLTLTGYAPWIELSFDRIRSNWKDGHDDGGA